LAAKKKKKDESSDSGIKYLSIRRVRRGTVGFYGCRRSNRLAATPLFRYNKPAQFLIIFTSQAGCCDHRREFEGGNVTLIDTPDTGVLKLEV
jgi:hypothetical protein